MKRIIILSLAILLSVHLLAQKTVYQPDSLSLMLKKGLHKPMSIEDSVMLSGLPELILPDEYRGPNAPLLPAVVDNSQHPFMRPAFQQAGYACGQAAGIGYNFTYAINRKRGVSGDIEENQYPTHFVWNWMNSGNNYGGVSYMHSFEILRHVGTPNVETYGGMSYGGEKRWMTGYDNYLSAMHNRIEEVYAIRLHTEEGFLTFKNWLNDHLEGSEYGGVASFYANHPQTWALPQGTPEAGKRVAIVWSAYSSHALTIVGYNDSIRWDYNNDGQFTNDLDLNGDGIVDVRDWEIGGFKFVNSYGGVPGWGDEGFCYMMYKTVADKYGEGGIWNNAVHCLMVKEDVEPKLTMKVKLKHNCRHQIKVKVGVAADASATIPDHTMGFPILDYQGACLNMQGGTGEEQKTIEVGLDITPLLNYIESAEEAKYFLIVDEDDPTGSGAGEIIMMSVINYSTDTTEYVCEEVNIPIPSNDQVALSVTATATFDDVSIDTDQLPTAQIYEPYSTQLTASGGTPPYSWEYEIKYDTTSSTETFPLTNEQELTPTSNTDGYAVQQLNFQFPFYGEQYETVYIYVDGFIKFDDQLVTWPYFQDLYLRFLKNKNIAPFFNVNLKINPDQQDGLWYEGTDEYAIFRWKLSQNNLPNALLNLAIKLYPSGKIEFYYGEMEILGYTDWFGGISNGDAVRFQESSISNSFSFPENLMIEFIPPDYPVEMELSSDGVFSGTPVNEYNATPFNVLVTDNNNISSSKTLNFTTEGIISEFTVHAGDNDSIEFGETVSLDLMVKNIGSSSYHNTIMTINTDDSYTTIVDGIENIGTIHGNQVHNVSNAFTFTVSDTIPNMHNILVNSIITSSEDDFERDHNFTAYAPELRAGYLAVDDGNNDILEPGETANIILNLENLGGASLYEIAAVLTSPDPKVTINDGTDTLSVLNGNSSGELVFNITASPQTPNGHILFFMIELMPENYVDKSDTLYLAVGETMEDFETGDFSKYPWYFQGDYDWIITNESYQGDFAARSAPMGDNDDAIMLLDIDVLSDSYISFYKKVSSEVDYDYLHFYIDGAEKAKWAGEWSWGKSTFPILKGSHTIKWWYKKDGSQTGGQDRAWIDNIILPPIADMLITINAGVDDTICEMDTYPLEGYTFNTESFHWETNGSGTFDNDTIINPVYTPGESDILSSAVVLSLHGVNEYGTELADYMTLFIKRLPIVNAGPDTTICVNNDLIVNGQIIFSESSTWTTSGDGEFDFPDQLIATYTPGTQDYENGIVELILSAVPLAPCTENIPDTLILDFWGDPIADAGEDAIACENNAYTLSGSLSNSNSSIWTTAGDGFFDDASLLDASYTAGSQDVTNGFVELTLTAHALYPCEGEDSDNILLTFEQAPVPDAGDDIAVQYNTTTTLTGAATGGSGDYSWYWTPDTYLEDPNVQSPTTTVLTNTITFQLTVTDNISACYDTDEVTVTVEGSPFDIFVSADPDNVCLGEMTQLLADVVGTTGPYSYSWTSVPEGFTADQADPVAYPEVSTSYFVKVTDASDNEVEGFITVEVSLPAMADAGEDYSICENETFTPNSSASNYSEIVWTTSGDGFFDDNTILQPVYTPGEEDILGGDVQLSLICTPLLPCMEAVTDHLTLFFYTLPEVTFNPLPDLCDDDPPYLLIEGDPSGGTYSGIGIIDGYFYPEIAGIGEHTLNYSYTDANFCTATADQILNVHNCTAINENSNNFTIKIIPNPNNGRFDLNINSTMEGEYNLKIIDTYGRDVFSQQMLLKAGENKMQLNLKELKGLYLVLIEGGDQLIATKLLIH